MLVSGQRADPAWSARFGVTCLSGEELSGRRDDAGGISDLRPLLPQAAELIAPQWRGHQLALASYGQWRQEWQKALADGGIHVHAPPIGRTLPRRLVDKTRMRPWLRRLGLVTPADAITSGLDHAHLRRRFATPYVVQRPRGTGGHGTYLVCHAEDLSRIPPGGPWLVSRYMDGVAINHHGLVGVDGTVCVLPASVQLTDLAGMGTTFGTYGGCDFGATRLLPTAAAARAREDVERVGKAIAQLGYRGTFGVDLLVSGDEVRFWKSTAGCKVPRGCWASWSGPPASCPPSCGMSSNSTAMPQVARTCWRQPMPCS
ncbi:hypothetical protein [Streptomyces sp. NPDC101150]|uniref:hypothetical protein n=1 Tax=Streptomyces sp. NPDC101150 TaxID=3366114 RepID=UPI0038169143